MTPAKDIDAAVEACRDADGHVDPLALAASLAAPDMRFRRKCCDDLIAVVRAYLAALASEQDAKAAWQRGAEREYSDHNAEPYAVPLTDAYDAAIDARVAAFQALTEAAR